MKTASEKLKHFTNTQQVVFDVLSRENYVVDVCHDDTPVSLLKFLQSSDDCSLKSGDALHSPGGMRRHSNKPSSHANAVVLQSRFSSGICQKANAKSLLVKNFAFPILERLLVYTKVAENSFIVAYFSSHSKSEARKFPSLPCQSN